MAHHTLLTLPAMLLVHRLPIPAIDDDASDPPLPAPTQMSANDSFFFSPPVHRPTPPPSIRSRPSSSPVKKSTPLPPIHRFFPSRNRPVLETDTDITTPRLVDLDEDDLFSHYPPRLPSPPPPPPPQEPPSLSLPADSPPLTASSLDTDEQPEPPSPPPSLQGSTIGSENNTPILLIRALGTGSFSSVWLAKDLSGLLTPTDLTKRPRRNNKGSIWRARLRSESVAKRKRDSRVHGLKPDPAHVDKPNIFKNLFKEGDSDATGVARQRSLVLRPPSPVMDTEVVDDDEPEPLVAVKMVARSLCDADDRMRISFVREVEVLRHISHPSIVSYLHSFTTPTHHALVLENVSGGELFNILNDDVSYNRMSEPIIRRIWSELVKALGWMHSVGLVHRDVKLENVLLTTNPLSSPTPTLPPSSIPLIKLTDFNLSRFIDFSSPLLVTKCGSEAYAAPEIITSKQYDGRQTDAWAAGVVLYGIACRRLPFDSPSSTYSSAHSSSTSISTHSTHSTHYTSSTSNERMSLLRRIASGAYTYPAPLAHPSSVVVTQPLKDVIGRLLVRDPTKRARLDSEDIWNEEWMLGKTEAEGGVRRPKFSHEREKEKKDVSSTSWNIRGKKEVDSEDLDGEEGVLVDREHISGVARSEIVDHSAYC